MIVKCNQLATIDNVVAFHYHVNTINKCCHLMLKRPPQINVRVSEELKEALHDAANVNSRSVNSEIVSRLEKSFGDESIDADSGGNGLAKQLQDSLLKQQRLIDAHRTMTEQMQFMADKYSSLVRHVLPAICESEVVRLQRTFTTYGDKDRLIAFFKAIPDISRILVAVRDGHSNYSAMTFVIYNESHIFIADAIPMTVERLPREAEVLELFEELDRVGLLDVTECILSRVEQTKDLIPEKAVNTLENNDSRPIRGNIYEFLSLFFREPEKVKPDWFVDEWKKLN